MSERLGVHGGTFNPPHRAHLALAAAAARELELDRVLLVPAARPAHKAVDQDPGAEERLALCRAAVDDADDPTLEVSDVELRREGPSYTAETLAELARRSPDAELVLLLGADAAAGLPDWHEPREVLDRAEVGVGERPGTTDDAVRAAFVALEATDRLRPFALVPQDVSSSDIRRRVAEGRPWEHLVTPGVAGRIVAGALYRTGAPSTVGGVSAAEPTTRDLAADDASPPGRSPADDAALAELVAAAATLAADRKAADLEAIDLREVSPYADAFLLCTGNTERQVKAIHDSVLEGLKRDRGMRPRSVEGVTEARWILMDYGDLIVHVQVPEARDFYRLGRLWGDRPRIPLPDLSGADADTAT